MDEQTQRAFSLSGSNVGKVRGLGPKDPNYKGTGYGPLIAGNIAEVASTIADDPVGFAKDTAVGAYEEGKDFLSRPIDYSKEIVQGVVESAADLKNKDINARLQEKYDVTFEQATPEQVDDIRQSILSDSMTASGLIPAAGLVGAKVLSKNIPLEIKPSEYGFRQDNPGESYTKTKQKIAENKAEEYKGEGGSIEKLLTGPITGTMGGDFKKSLFLDTTFLSKIKGANDEVRRSGDIKYEDLKKTIEEKGFDPEQKVYGYDFKPEGIANAISIGVNHKGQAFLLEGNTRVALAKEMNIPSVRAEVKYFNGAEEIDSPYSPKNILKYAEKPKEFNKGGTAMKDQMEMNFGQAETVDPVSGNDVPPGSLPEEVRDDIDAKLSEGEYVVPADVVRFFGVKFFEDLRTMAKTGLQKMDEEGRIGGEPVAELPFDISELEVEDDDGMRMAIGGLVPEYNVGGYQQASGVGSSFGGFGGYGGYKPYNPTVTPVTTTTPPPPVTPAAPVNTGSQVKTYYDKMGNPVSVMFINGQPQQSLQGLTTSNPNASGDSGPVNINLNNPLVNAPVSSGTSARQEVDKDNLLNMNSDQLDSYIATQMGKGEGIMERIVPGLVGAAVSTINPLAGLAVGQGMVSRSNLKGLENAEVALRVMESRFGPSKNKDVAAARAAQKIEIEKQRKGGLADELLSKLYSNADARAKAILESPVISPTERDETKKAFSKSAVAPSQQPKYTRSKAEELLGIKTPSLRVETRASDGREAVANSKDPSQYNWEDVNRLRSHDSAANRNKLAQWNREVEAGNAKTGSSKGLGGGGEGSDKIVCTAMNEAYGFGSFRNKIWLTHSAKHLTKAHQVGYHTLFLPLINLGYKKDYKFIRACLENIARHRTSDIYYQSKGSKRDTLGRIYRFTLEPLCYVVGKIVLLKGNKNGN